jgi:hypothetical protein
MTTGKKDPGHFHFLSNDQPWDWTQALVARKQCKYIQCYSIYSEIPI